MDKLVGFARKKRLGDLLVDAGVISQDQLVKALQIQKTEKQGERLGVVLIDLGFTDEKQIVEALKAQLKIQSVDLSTLRIPEEIIRLLDEAVLRKYNLIPFKFNEKKSQSFVRGNERSAGYPGDGRCFHHYRVSGGAFCCNPE